MLAVSMPIAEIDRFAISHLAASGCRPGSAATRRPPHRVRRSPDSARHRAIDARIRFDQDDRPIGDAAVLALRTLDVRHGHEVVGARDRGVPHIDDHGLPDQAIERNLIDRQTSLREVNRGVDMRRRAQT